MRGLGLGLSLTRRGGAAAFNPLTLSPLAIWDASAGTAGSTDGSAVSAVTDQSPNGNNLSQGTGANQPILRIASGVSSFDFDGINDGLTTASARTWAANVDVFIAMKPDVGETSWVPMLGGDEGGFIGVASSGSAAANSNNAGTPTTVVDGAALATNDRDGIYTKMIAGGTPHVLEVRNADLTNATWATMRIANFTGFEYDGRIYWIGIFPALSAANRALVRTYAGAKAGIVV